LTPQTEAICLQCGQPYHLNQRQDLDGRDCGQVWINEEHLALEFACNTCLNPPAPAGALDEVLELEEAAALLQLPESALIEAADAGTVRHRRTARGVYLFERRDLAALRGR
jgi:hypothetical protein